ncbi:MAG: hypothetical protein JSS87_09345 [Acidobacteria bacterium]|nr:hypothetical protein [Acidobacteriota bacterium]
MKLRRLAKRTAFGTAAAIALAALVYGGSLYLRGRLPYHDSFTTNEASEWRQFGGAWQMRNGAMYNRSDERGAKLLAGSSRWKNYKLQTDLQIIGHEGEVGVVVRAGDAERGVDSYNGYYVGLRSSDSALVIGRADHGWVEALPIAMKGDVKIGAWYRLQVVAVDCNIGASATNIATGATSWAAFHEQNCVREGQIGLRSMGTGGAWRHLTVETASAKDWDVVRAHAPSVNEPAYPGLEADYSRMREAYDRQKNTSAHDAQITVEGFPTRAAYRDLAEDHIVPVEELRKNVTHDGEVAVRGVVTLASPLYVQDATGGIAVDAPHPIALNLGDEVQISGRPLATGVSPRMVAEHIRLLWDRTQAVPLSITSTQAASGAFASSLVGVQGKLVSRQRQPNGTMRLQMEDASQSFTAYVTDGLSMHPLDEIEDGSLLRLRGICDFSNVSRESGSFAILLRSMDDIEVLSGPPLWSGKRVAQAILAGIILIAIGVWIYLRIERWKMRAIMSERERLAHEMHDTLAQSFAGVGFHLQGVRNSLRSGKAAKESVLEKLDVACDLVTQTHRDASAGIAALHPDADEGRDLLVALERCLHAMLEGDDLPLTLVREGTPRPLSLPVRDALFQIGREAITNVLRHSGAGRITLKLRYEPRAVSLEIRDDGRGFHYDPQTTDFGIRTMHRRVKSIDAELSIDTAPGLGAVIMVRSPYGRKFTFGDWLRALRHALPHRSV